MRELKNVQPVVASCELRGCLCVSWQVCWRTPQRCSTYLIHLRNQKSVLFCFLFFMHNFRSNMFLCVNRWTSVEDKVDWNFEEYSFLRLILKYYSGTWISIETRYRQENRVYIPGRVKSYVEVMTSRQTMELTHSHINLTSGAVSAYESDRDVQLASHFHLVVCGVIPPIFHTPPWHIA